MSRAVSRLLSKGIGHLAQGGTVRDFVSHPEASQLSAAQRKELASLLETAAELLSLEEAPVPVSKGKGINRVRFLSEAVHLREEQRPRTLRDWLRVPPRLRHGLVPIAMVFVLLLAAGTGAVSASASSLPGTPLYAIKLAAEDLRLAFTVNSASRAGLYIRFANERTTEMVRLASEGHPVDFALVERMEQFMRQALLTAQSTSGDQGRKLLEQVIETSDLQQERLRRVSAEAAPHMLPALHAGLATAREVSGHAEVVLRALPTPTPMPTALPSTGAPPQAPTEPPVVAVVTGPPPATKEPGPPSRPSDTPLPATPGLTSEGPSPTPLQTGTLAPTSPITPTLSITPAVTVTLVPTPTGSETPGTITPTPSETVATVTTEPSETPEATKTPAALFRVTNSDRPDPVPPTHRIRYETCVINEGDVPLTNVVVVFTWGPREYVYRPPENLSEVRRNLGTLDAHECRCINFTLNTYSTGAGHTVTARAVMICDQGTAQATATTYIGTPITRTPTATPSPTLTPVPTQAAEETPTQTVPPTPTAPSAAMPTGPATPTPTPTA